MKVVPLEAFRDKIPLGVAVAAVERSFRALALGEATLPDPMVVELKDLSAEVHVKGAHLKGARHVVLKLATGFYKNRERGLPSGDGLFLLRDALLVGAGAVGRLAARAIIGELPIERLTVWNRTAARAEALVAELVSGGVVKARVAQALEPEVRRHRVIVTATASTTPVIKAAWVAKGTHITSVGTGSPEKVELEPELLRKADKLVADRVAQTSRYGNLHHAIEAGVLDLGAVYGELGDLAAGRLAGRGTADEITIADLTGVGVQDAAIAASVVEALGL